MSDIVFQETKFLKSVTSLSDLPPAAGSEIAFVGRSNAGKSSAINTITGLKGLVRTSKTPGCTRCINYFQVDRTKRLVDLPGYGFAKVPKSVKERWEKMIDTYLQERECLRGLVLIMDIRHILQPLDIHLLNWTTEIQLPTHILLSKSDKLKTAQARKALNTVLDYLDDSPHASAQLFSSLTKTGCKEARKHLSCWFASQS
jgi:GTP-binding protein